ncbi:hypothetical protein KQX54_014307 [Cotesia glomerata]|uniref:Uncharacterized protein n=1 Tax=Cotesia glomerata TaxID=32391 RepID=A0AAV7I3X1_COTGL|nr:hypothetical protein KQX54_014307 [Cotesia glomerata]
MVYRVGGCWRRVPGQKKGLSSFSRLGTRDSGRRSLGVRFAFVSAITFLFSLLLIWDSLGCSSLPFELSPFVSPLPVDSRRSLNYQAARYRETRDSKGLLPPLSGNLCLGLRVTPGQPPAQIHLGFRALVN